MMPVVRLVDIPQDPDTVEAAISFTPEQREVFDRITNWVERSAKRWNVEPAVLTLGGYAGTGKSTLLAMLANYFSASSMRPVFCAYTGKATSVLRQKVAMYAPDLVPRVQTIHSFLYRPILNKKTKAIAGWERKKREEIECDVIVVDEASMVNEGIYSDLLSLGLPLLAVGDHGQLPPIDGSFNLMENPQLRLETIHRQAATSPIIALSERVRNMGGLPAHFDNAGVAVQIASKKEVDLVLSSIYGLPNVTPMDVGFLCYTNRVRVNMNKKARRIWWESFAPGSEVQPIPMAYDALICLRNTHVHVFNGMRGYATGLGGMVEVDHRKYRGTVLFPEEGVELEGEYCTSQLGRVKTYSGFNEYCVENHLPRNVDYTWEDVGMLFDYGYALTVHKSQGSSFKYVIVFDDMPSDTDADTSKRWWYTAITRSRSNLVILR